MRTAKLRIALGLASGAALCWALPATADVKDGVDAWGAGDFAGAVREWQVPAAQGDADAQFNLAQAYRLGRGVEADPRQAETLYARAAAQGHVRAADNYGLILFQDGRREQAMPYIRSASERGDPRAQYLMGLAYFNGDLAEKDWRRAYALMTMAHSSGLPQSRLALAQMDEFIPLADRQAAQVLVEEMRAEAGIARQRELAAVDLALAGGEPRAVAVTAPARPAVAAPTVAPRPAVTPVATPAPARQSTAAGPWKLQLGAFGVPGNADRMWSQLSGRPELAGRSKLKQAAGKLTMLYAAGFATREEAASACGRLKAAEKECLVSK